jgi:hypothetical protein
MNLQEEVSRIKEVMGINESFERLAQTIQEIIDKAFQEYMDLLDDYDDEDSGFFDLSSIDFIHKLESLEKIQVDDIEREGDKLKVYVNIHTNGDYENFGFIAREIEHTLKRFIPNISLVIRKVIRPERFNKD